jgi:hypothetical protein
LTPNTFKSTVHNSLSFADFDQDFVCFYIQRLQEIDIEISKVSEDNSVRKKEELLDLYNERLKLEEDLIDLLVDVNTDSEEKKDDSERIA